MKIEIKNNYSNVETEIETEDGCLSCFISFDYQPPETSYFDYIIGVGSPGVNEAVEITKVAVEQRVDLLEIGNNWVSIMESVNQAAFQHIEDLINEAREIALDAQIADME